MKRISIRLRPLKTTPSILLSSPVRPTTAKALAPSTLTRQVTQDVAATLTRCSLSPPSEQKIALLNFCPSRKSADFTPSQGCLSALNGSLSLPRPRRFANPETTDFKIHYKTLHTLFLIFFSNFIAHFPVNILSSNIAIVF